MMYVASVIWPSIAPLVSSSLWRVDWSSGSKLGERKKTRSLKRGGCSPSPSFIECCCLCLFETRRFIHHYLLKCIILLLVQVLPLKIINRGLSSLIMLDEEPKTCAQSLSCLSHLTQTRLKLASRVEKICTQRTCYPSLSS